MSVASFSLDQGLMGVPSVSVSDCMGVLSLAWDGFITFFDMRLEMAELAAASPPAASVACLAITANDLGGSFLAMAPVLTSVIGVMLLLGTDATGGAIPCNCWIFCLKDTFMMGLIWATVSDCPVLAAPLEPAAKSTLLLMLAGVLA